MRILTISNYFPNHRGGIEFVALNLVSKWRERHQVKWAACDVVLPAYQNHVDDISFPACNFAETRLGFPYPIPTIKAIPAIFVQTRWSNIVHIHDCLYFTSIVAFFASLAFSKPLVVTQHVGYIPYTEPYKRILQMYAYRTIGRLILKGSNKVIFVNRQTKEWFEREIKISQTTIIENGVDNKIFHPSDKIERQAIRNWLGFAEKEILLLFIGRFTQKKGIHIIKEIALNRPQYNWILIGDGDIDISSWNLPNVKVIPTLPQAQLRAFYVAADFLVLPSTGEGFPLAVQEALSCGLPVAVSEETAKSLPEAPLVGLNVSSPLQILDTLDQIINDPNFQPAARQKAIDFSRQWDWSNAAHEYEVIFSEAIANYPMNAR